MEGSNTEGWLLLRSAFPFAGLPSSLGVLSQSLSKAYEPYMVGLITPMASWVLSSHSTSPRHLRPRAQDSANFRSLHGLFPLPGRLSSPAASVCSTPIHLSTLRLSINTVYLNSTGYGLNCVPIMEKTHTHTHTPQTNKQISYVEALTTNTGASGGGALGR